eukprot:2289771-Rhodomonas_salina.2
MSSMLLRTCYGVSGTEIGCGAGGGVAEAQRRQQVCQQGTNNSTTTTTTTNNSTKNSTCSALASCTRARYAMSGTDAAYSLVWCGTGTTCAVPRKQNEHCVRRGPVLTQGTVVPERVCYTVLHGVQY